MTDIHASETNSARFGVYLEGNLHAFRFRMRSEPSVHPVWKVLKVLIYGAWCIGGLAFGIAAGWLEVGKDTVTGSLTVQKIRQTPPQEIFSSNVLYLLVLGCDENRSFIDQSVTKRKARSDMMLCLRLDFESNTLTGISIPRDLLVQVPGYRMQKINAYHLLGGPELAQQAAEQVLGVRIDRTAVLDYDAFQRVVNLVGGVEVFVPKKMKWTDRAGDLYIDLEPGRQVLNGYNALGFVRFRHSDSDYERQRRQKEFMVAFKNSVMARPEVLPSIANEAVNLLGGTLEPSEVASLMLFAQRIGQDNIRMGMVPVTEGSDRRFGFYQEVDEVKLPEVLEQFRFLERGWATGGMSDASRF